MQTEHLIHCPSCQSTDFTSIGEIKDYYYSQDSFPIVSCKNCSLVFTQNRPNAESIGAYYDSANYASHDGSKKKSMFLQVYVAARNYMLKKKHDLVRPFKPEWSRVLDYGAGEGYFVEYLLKKGKQVEGIEPSNVARSNFYSRNGQPMYSNLVELPKEKTFQVITLWHVLEHIHTLKETMQSLVDKLESKGIIVIAVPNQNSLDKKVFGNYWAAWDVPRHLYHWSPDSLSTFMSGFGLQNIHTNQLPLDPIYIGMISAKYAKKSSIHGIWQGIRSYFHGKQNPKNGSTLLSIWMKN